MKFQKGLLNDLTKPAPVSKDGGIVSPRTERHENSGLSETVGEDRLFQTHRRTSRSWREYVKLLGSISLVIGAAGLTLFYFNLPDRGDAIRAPSGLEEAIRNHFLEVEKRNVTNIGVYYCETHYWVRVDVEKRPDIKTNAVYQIGSYAARAESRGKSWVIRAVPISASETDQPCSL